MKDRTPPTIGGLPAPLWLNRVIFIASRHGKAATGTKCPATLISIHKAHYMVQPKGHRHPEKVPFSAVSPWWAKSPDLKSLQEKTTCKLPVSTGRS